MKEIKIPESPYKIGELVEYHSFVEQAVPLSFNLNNNVSVRTSAAISSTPPRKTVVQLAIVLRRQYSTVQNHWGYVVFLQNELRDCFAVEHELNKVGEN